VPRYGRESVNESSVVWPYPGIATGVGSMPGTDPREATAIVVGEIGSFPHVVELPARGPGSDPIGRTASLLASVDRSFDVETTVTGWRVGHAGRRTLRNARAWLSQDLEVLEEECGAHRGPVKIQVVGPLTLSARIEDAAGESLVRDHGAVAEIAEAAASAFSELTQRMRRAFPHAEVIIQVDEADLPAVLSGRVRTSSGRLTYRSVKPPIVQGHLRTVVDAIATAGAVAGIRCAKPAPPIQLFIDAGARFVALDLELTPPPDEALLRAWEDGVGLLLGCVPVASLDRPDIGDRDVSAGLRRFMSESGFTHVPANVALTPSEGLAGVDPQQARRAIERCVRIGSIVRDDHPEVVGG
jgi:hypothetical protein